MELHREKWLDWMVQFMISDTKLCCDLGKTM